MSCKGAVEGVHEDCCHHTRPQEPNTSVCCWCGYVYWQHDPGATHGPYQPGITDRESNRRMARLKKDQE